MPNQFGERIKELRESTGLLQREVAARLSMDSPMLSKIERGERRARKDQVLTLARLYKGDKQQLLTLWLADQLVEIVQGEEVALQAMQVAEQEISYASKSKNTQKP